MELLDVEWNELPSPRAVRIEAPTPAAAVSMRSNAPPRGSRSQARQGWRVVHESPIRIYASGARRQRRWTRLYPALAAGLCAAAVAVGAVISAG
jgi:hypothetical protein